MHSLLKKKKAHSTGMQKNTINGHQKHACIGFIYLIFTSFCNNILNLPLKNFLQITTSQVLNYKNYDLITDKTDHL